MATRKKKQPARTEPDQPRAQEGKPVAEPTTEGSHAVDDRTQPAPAIAPTENQPPRQWQLDPFPLLTITLGDAKDSPRMTLFRNNRLNQIDGNPLRHETR